MELRLLTGEGVGVPDLEAAIRAILARHPCARPLMLDCWQLGKRDGESEGLRFAAAYLAALDASAARGVEMGVYRRWPECRAYEPGAVLGEKPLPPGGEWWGLLEGGAVVPGADRRARESRWWCRGAAGWWRVPADHLRDVTKAIAPKAAGEGGLFDEPEGAA